MKKIKVGESKIEDPKFKKEIINKIKSGNLDVYYKLFILKEYNKYLIQEELELIFLDKNSALKDNLLQVFNEDASRVNRALLILRNLHILGDPTAKSLCKKLILHALTNGEYNTIQYILQFDYVDLIEIQEFEAVIQDRNSSLRKIIFKDSKKIGILHYGPSLEFLKRLAEIGVPTAKKVLREEIIKKINEGLKKGVNYLIGSNYCFYLDKNDIKQILEKFNIDLIDFFREKLIKLEMYDYKNELLEFLKKVYGYLGGNLIQMLFEQIFDKVNTLTEGYFLGLKMIYQFSSDTFVVEKIKNYLTQKQHFLDSFLTSYNFFDILEFLLDFFNTQEVIKYTTSEATFITQILKRNFILTCFKASVDELEHRDTKVINLRKKVFMKLIENGDVNFNKMLVKEMINILHAYFRSCDEIVNLIGRDIIIKYGINIDEIVENYDYFYKNSYYADSNPYRMDAFTISEDLIDVIKSKL